MYNVTIQTTETGVNYSSFYGKVSFSFLGNERPVKGFRITKDLPSECFLDSDTKIPEQIVLITCNERLQMGFQYPFVDKLVVVLYHTGPSTVYLLKLKSLSYARDDDPAETIRILNKRSVCYV